MVWVGDTESVLLGSTEVIVTVPAPPLSTTVAGSTLFWEVITRLALPPEAIVPPPDNVAMGVVGH